MVKEFEPLLVVEGKEHGVWVEIARVENPKDIYEALASSFAGKYLFQSTWVTKITKRHLGETKGSYEVVVYYINGTRYRFRVEL